MNKLVSIFIVENDFSLQVLYRKILEYGGFKVIETAITGDEAIIKYKKMREKPDLVLLDFRMPIKNGLEITKEILDINKGATIIVASGDASVKGQALEVGAKIFLKKPFTGERLLCEINELMFH
ncbi:MAG: response regulator [Candidatus Lokiarchaeota archaeon]|nr:response regulator [Candidatus Lokiarchaeota archaeon]